MKTRWLGRGPNGTEVSRNEGMQAISYMNQNYFQYYFEYNTLLPSGIPLVPEGFASETRLKGVKVLGRDDGTDFKGELSAIRSRQRIELVYSRRCGRTQR